MKQLSLIDKPELQLGGSLSKGKRKSLRPLCSKRTLHLVLKSKKELLLNDPLNRNTFQVYLWKYSQKFNVALYNWSIQKDHVHLQIKIPSRENYKSFIRSLTGQLTREWGKGIWQVTPYTRVLHWGQDFENVKKYIFQNEAEVQGFTPYKRRSNVKY
ncbi:MAG: transposase [Bdellovibrionales bacterium]|nr:transposase [Bdellovibrionales bacterium]